jgi:two-component system, sensor histidine kinase and response regulator
VDDREANLLSLEQMPDNDHRVFIKSRSGNDALKQALKHEDIGLILLDVQMPDMDGFEVARLLKSSAKTSDISIIFVTAISKDEQYVLKGFEEGAVDYLHKPLDINVTRAKVNVFERLYFFQHELKEALKKVEEVNKQLEKFVYTVAHDIKSPLTGIKGLLSILEGDKTIKENGKLSQFVGLSVKAADHLSGMVSSILEYSKTSIDQQKVEEVNTKALVEEIAVLLFPPKHITITTTDEMPVLKTKKLKIQQVFQNLVSNALKYNDKEQGYIEIGCKDKTMHYEFYVKDNGQGITEENNKIVFKLFSTTDNESNRDSSTGVGLNIVKLMIEEQGGKIWVDSVPGEGSTFFFEWKK